MISDYIRLWVISHPWNMRITKESLNPTVHQSQYTSTPPRGCPSPPTVIVEPALDPDRGGGSLCPPAETHNPPLISSFPLSLSPTVIVEPALDPVIVGAGPCARPRKPTTRPSFRHSAELVPDPDRGAGIHNTIINRTRNDIPRGSPGHSAPRSRPALGLIGGRGQALSGRP